MGYVLRIVSGEREGESIELAEGRVLTLGRDQDTSVPLDDRKLSRIHCQIVADGGECVLTDLNSTNGTYVNGKKIEQVTLEPGDIVRIGLTEINIEKLGGDESPAEQPEERDEAAPAEMAGAEAAEAQCVACGGAITTAMIESGEVRRVGSRFYCPGCRASFSRRGEQPPAAPAEEDEPIVDVTPPESFAGIRVVEKVGSSFFGQLYKVEQTDVGRAMLLLLVTAGDGEWHERLLKAVYDAGKLIHPNILLTYDTGHWEQLPYVAWEYAEGSTLDTLLAKTGPQTLAEVVPVISQLAAALEYSSEQLVHHGILCPDFIVITDRGRVKVFGYALGALPAPRTWKHRFPLGALPYLPPEQVAGEAGPSFAGDVYSLGAIFYFMLTGKPPWSETNYEALVREIRATDRWKTLSERLPGLSLAVRRVMERCLAPRMAARYPRARDLIIDLEGLAREA